MRPSDLVRLILRHYPFTRGVGVAIRLLGGHSIKPADGQWARSRFGPVYRLRNDHVCWSVYVAGIYEPHNTRIFRHIVRPGDTLIDVGANFGWYTIQGALLVGPQGRVLAFEPLPSIFADLQASVERNGFADRVTLHNFGLGDTTQDLILHTFDGLNIGQSSVSNLGRPDAHEIKSRSEPLDDVLTRAGVGQADVLKCDVEGYERNVFSGARRLLSSHNAPIVMFEGNPTTAAAFGYTICDLANILCNAGYTHFYRAQPGGWLLPVAADTSLNDRFDDYFAAKECRLDRLRPRMKS